MGAETFAINDSTVGKSFTIRGSTDEQLARYRHELTQQQAQAHQSMMNALATLQNIGIGLNVIIYEQDRRARSFAIATGIPKLQ